MFCNKRYTRRALDQEVNHRSVTTKSRVSTLLPDTLKLCLREATGQVRTKQNKIPGKITAILKFY